MAMVISTSHYTVAQLNTAIEDKHLTINRDYQRSDEVWPLFARSLLVETVILGYPMPKLIIRQRTDMKSLKTFSEIVDGQQRTRTLLDFFKGGFVLSNTLETEHLRGCAFDDLEEVDRERFVSYPVGVDVLLGATELETIEVFRRMNSYTAPLNGEEQRHATYQGPFKWFIWELRKTCESVFSDIGVFKQKGFVRMQDAKLLTELTHAVENGITTTTKKSLEALYLKYNKQFPQVDDMRTVVVQAISKAASFEAVSKTDLAKHYNFYSLVLATMQASTPQPALVAQLDGLDGELIDDNAVSENLAKLSNALETEDPDNPEGEYAEFVKAASQTTNTKANRAIRYRWFYKALIGEL